MHIAASYRAIPYQRKAAMPGPLPNLAGGGTWGCVTVPSPRDWGVTFIEKGMISPENEIKNVPQGQMISVDLKSAGAKQDV
jgi:hypothetical protein